MLLILSNERELSMNSHFEIHFADVLASTVPCRQLALSTQQESKTPIYKAQGTELGNTGANTAAVLGKLSTGSWTTDFQVLDNLLRALLRSPLAPLQQRPLHRLPPQQPPGTPGLRSAGRQALQADAIAEGVGDYTGES